MLGNWLGFYKYSLPEAQRAIGFDQTYFTICITSFDGEYFSGTVKDDTNTGGMEGEGIIKGAIKNGKIAFEKHMPKRVQIIDRQGTRKTLNESHPTLYYSGIFCDGGQQINGKWQFNYRLALLLGFIPIIYRPGKGTFGMRLINNTKLSKEQFNATMATTMVDVTVTAVPVVDIWPFAEQLAKEGIVHEHVLKEHLVEKVYRGQNTKFDHILLPTQSQNSFIAIVVDISEKYIVGYYNLDLNKEYYLLNDSYTIT